MRREICYDNALLRNEIENFRAEGWTMVRHAFFPGIGTGKSTRDNARKQHIYTFEKSN